MTREAPKYDWKCLQCGRTYAQKTADDIDYCLRCGCDRFYQRLYGDWSLRPVRMGASVKSGKRAMKHLLQFALAMVALLILAVLAGHGCAWLINWLD